MVARNFDAARRRQRDARYKESEDGSAESARGPAIIRAVRRVHNSARDQAHSGTCYCSSQHPAIRIGQIEVASGGNGVNAGAADGVLQADLRVAAIEDVEIQRVVGDIVNCATKIFAAPQRDFDRSAAFQFSDAGPVVGISRGGKIGNEKQQKGDHGGKHSAHFDAPELANKSRSARAFAVRAV